MQQQLPQNVDLKQMDDVSCSSMECESINFIQGSRFKRVPGLLVGAAQDNYVPIPLVLCAVCGTAAENFIPKEVYG